MKKIKTIIAVLICVFCVTSCSKWFDVKPKKMVEQDDLFSTENGFKEALTGIYLKMGDKEIYGRATTYGFMDVLAQYYQKSEEISGGHQDKLNYVFPSTITENYVKGIWSTSYNVIANINNLLLFLEKNREVLVTEGYYEIMKGEALGLRAFLHFDLLRIYGPIYKLNKGASSIVYRTEFDADSKRLKSAQDIVSLVLNDLKEAELLLKNDAMSMEFPTSSSDEADMAGDKFLVYRHKRMNLYAVKGLMARVNMYADQKTDAMKYAKEVIESPYFSLIKSNTTDKIFSKEIIFSIYIPKFKTYYQDDFSGSNGYIVSEASFLDNLYSTQTDGKNDIRYKSYAESGKIFIQSKYEQTNMWASTEQTIPLIRLPEMYYILAECSSDPAESSAYLSEVREARAIDAIEYTDNEKLMNIEKEYRKEFSGEGQLFYFYKRHAYKTFVNSPLKDMTASNYIFSLPDNEKLFGGVE